MYPNFDIKTNADSILPGDDRYDDYLAFLKNGGTDYELFTFANACGYYGEQLTVAWDITVTELAKAYQKVFGTEA